MKTIDNFNIYVIIKPLKDKEVFMHTNFGEFLKEKRQQKNLTQKQLAEQLIVSESAVCKWEKNVAYPDITLLPKLAEILDVTEHELITASVDHKSREEKKQAKKWRNFSYAWNLSFCIAYGVALIPCFICNLAVNKTLSWFFIVLSALILAFTFTNLPRYIKKHRLIFLPLSSYLALTLLLGVCCIYTKGDWFFIPTCSVFLALVIIFTPIYISKYQIFSKIKKFNGFISFAIYFVVLNILLIIIDLYCTSNGYSLNHWYLNIALPITAYCYLVLNLCLAVRFIKINKLFKTGIILAILDAFIYIPPLFVRSQNLNVQLEIDQVNILKANLAVWNLTTIENNVHLIVFLSFITLALIFTGIGLVVHIKRKNKNALSK